MNKRSQRVWLNIKVELQKRWLWMKKALGRLWKNTTPLFGGKYWLIYIAAFGFGFYLFGPIHGYRQLREWRPAMQIGSRAKDSSIETLKKEINMLKKDLRKIQTGEISQQGFNPRELKSPVIGEVINPFEWVNSGNSWKLHAGVDIAVSPGTNVVAAASGIAIKVEELIDGSYSVRIQHGNGWESVYSNLSRVMAKEGEKVVRGFVLGTSGIGGCNSEEPSIHFAVYCENQPVNPEKLIPGLMSSSG